MQVLDIQGYCSNLLPNLFLIAQGFELGLTNTDIANPNFYIIQVCFKVLIQLSCTLLPHNDIYLLTLVSTKARQVMLGAELLPCLIKSIFCLTNRKLVVRLSDKGIDGLKTLCFTLASLGKFVLCLVLEHAFLDPFLSQCLQNFIDRGRITSIFFHFRHKLVTFRV